jgi:hypothetical protein
MSRGGLWPYNDPRDKSKRINKLSAENYSMMKPLKHYPQITKCAREKLRGRVPLSLLELGILITWMFKRGQDLSLAEERVGLAAGGLSRWRPLLLLLNRIHKVGDCFRSLRLQKRARNLYRGS